MNRDADLQAARAHLGQVLGTSPWYSLDQARIQAFADATGDQQFIHVDPNAAAASPFGQTIAHGFLTASLIATMARETLDFLADGRLFINYGFDRLRFLTPVPSGGRVRAQFTLDAVDPRGDQQLLYTLDTQIELEGATKPALAATWLCLTGME